MEYIEFRIQVGLVKIAAERDEWPAVDGEVSYRGLRKDTVDFFIQRLEENEIKSRSELALLGSYLYSTLFAGKVHGALTRAYNELRPKSEKALRLVLEFLPDAREELANPPWEYLYFPSEEDGGEGRGFFIATRSDLILSRHVPRTIKGMTWTADPVLRILVVISQPDFELVEVEDRENRGMVVKQRQDMKEVDSEPLLRALGDLEHQSDGRVVVTQLCDPTKRTLREAICDPDAAKRPHVVHFLGHGRFDERTGGELALVRPELSDEARELKIEHGREALWVDDAAIADIFKDYKPRLVFLEACKGAASDLYHAFTGIALNLVREAVPAVIAMRYPISNTEAAEFSVEFYRSLTEGCAIDEAVQRGRDKLGTNPSAERNFSTREFGSPVVFFQCDRGFKSFDQIVRSRQPSVAKQPCPKCAEMVKPKWSTCPDCGASLCVCSSCGKVTLGEMPKCKHCDQPLRPLLAADAGVPTRADALV